MVIPAAILFRTFIELTRDVWMEVVDVPEYGFGSIDPLVREAKQKLEELRATQKDTLRTTSAGRVRNLDEITPFAPAAQGTLSNTELCKIRSSFRLSAFWTLFSMFCLCLAIVQ